MKLLMMSACVSLYEEMLLESMEIQVKRQTVCFDTSVTRVKKQLSTVCVCDNRAGWPLIAFTHSYVLSKQLYSTCSTFNLLERALCASTQLLKSVTSSNTPFLPELTSRHRSAVLHVMHSTCAFRKLHSWYVSVLMLHISET